MVTKMCNQGLRWGGPSCVGQSRANTGPREAASQRVNTSRLSCPTHLQLCNLKDFQQIRVTGGCWEYFHSFSRASRVNNECNLRFLGSSRKFCGSTAEIYTHFLFCYETFEGQKPNLLLISPLRLEGVLWALTWICGTHKVDGAEAPVPDLPQVGEQLLRVILEEKLSHLGVLQAAGPGVGRHGEGQGKPPAGYRQHAPRRSHPLQL